MWSSHLNAPHRIGRASASAMMTPRKSRQADGPRIDAAGKSAGSVVISIRIPYYRKAGRGLPGDDSEQRAAGTALAMTVIEGEDR